MRRSLLLFLGVAIALTVPRLGGAIELPFSGTLSLHLFANPMFPPFQVQGSGVADAALNESRVVTGFDIPGLVFEATQVLALTDPTVFPIAGLRATWSNDAGSFLSRPEGFGGPMPLRGTAKVCLFAACSEAAVNIEVPLSVVGTDATATVVAATNLTVVGAPWTVGPIELAQGNNPAPLHLTGSKQAGSLNLVTPIFVSTNIGTSAVVSSYARLALSFTTPPDGSCDNDVDDDGDGFTDFPDDPGCDAADDPSERTPAAPCDDGLDNDGDLRGDAFDPGCEGPLDGSERSSTLVCDDGFDNDDDLVIDFPGDPGCASSVDPSERGNGAVACDDGLDNDGDTYSDFPDDPGCEAVGDKSERGAGLACDDGVDNDGDLVTDHPADTGCASIFDPSERSVSRICDDGVDQDGDGSIDFPTDPGCASTADASERGATLPCDDTLDNDFDDAKDFPGDPGCSHPGDTSEQSLSLACDNALDDDADGLIDSQQDPGCDTPADPREAFDFDDGRAHRVDAAQPSPDHSVAISANGGGFASALSLYAGAVIAGDVIVLDNSYLEMRDGSVNGDLIAMDDAGIVIRGGMIEGHLEVGGTSRVEIGGTSFDLPYGEVLATSGTIVGTLLDGSAVSIAFTRAVGATLVLVPEADVSIATIVAFAALLIVRATRSRRGAPL